MEKNKKKIIMALTAFLFITAIIAGALFLFAFSGNKEENSVPSVSVSEIIMETEPATEPEPESILPKDWDSVYEYNPSPQGITQKTKNLYHKNPNIAT